MHVPKLFSTQCISMLILLLLGISCAPSTRGYNIPITVQNLDEQKLVVPLTMFSKRSTIHTAISKGQPGYPDWKIRYIKVTCLIPIQNAAAIMIATYTNILERLANMDLDDQLTKNAGIPFEMLVGGSHLNFYAPVGKLTKDFVVNVVEELLESTKLGWVTHFKSEWKDLVSGFTVYITLALGDALGPKGIEPGPIDRL